MAAVGEHGELDAGRSPIGEERLDPRSDRAAGVEDVVDEDAGHSLEREVESRGADERLGVRGRLAGADVDVVAVERDVELAERHLGARQRVDPPAQTLSERDAPRVDADESDPSEVGVPLDDLVRDPRQGPLDRLGVENDLRLRDVRGQPALRVLLTVDSFPASRDRVKGVVIARDSTRPAGRKHLRRR
jgi:hypothetical protein